MKNQPLIISITQHGVKYTVEFEHSDLNGIDFADAIVNLACSVGYSQTMILEHFKEIAEERLEATK